MARDAAIPAHRSSLPAWEAGNGRVDVSQLRLVAAHAWDVAGALGAGCLAAFVARPGMVLDPLAPRPDVIGADLERVADALL